MKLVLSFLMLMLFSCTARKVFVITIESPTDSCYAITKSNNKSLEVSRELHIIENTLTDTIGIGFSAIYPGYIGKLNYLRANDSGSGSVLYLGAGQSINDLPKTKSICFNLYQNRKVKGHIVIKCFP